MLRASSRTVVVTALTLAFLTLRLEGHAILLSTMPAPNEIVYGTTVHLRLRFSSRIDIKRSRLTLFPPGGPERVLPAEEVTPGTLKSDLAELLPGRYLLRWQVLAEDGHITRGELTFRTQ
jgi:methionine-rich copper-binding protein CopC